MHIAWLLIKSSLPHLGIIQHPSPSKFILNRTQCTTRYSKSTYSCIKSISFSDFYYSTKSSPCLSTSQLTSLQMSRQACITLLNSQLLSVDPVLDRPPDIPLDWPDDSPLHLPGGPLVRPEARWPENQNCSLPLAASWCAAAGCCSLPSPLRPGEDNPIISFIFYIFFVHEISPSSKYNELHFSLLIFFLQTDTIFTLNRKYFCYLIVGHDVLLAATEGHQLKLTLLYHVFYSISCIMDFYSLVMWQ